MDRSRWLSLYVLGIGVATGAVLCVAGASSIMHAQYLQQLPLLILLVGVGVVCSRQRVHYSDSSSIVMGNIAQAATILLLPLPLALLAIAAAKLITIITHDQGKRRRIREAVVNVGNPVLASGAAGLAFHLFLGDQFLWQSGWRPLLAFPALAALTIAYQCVDVLVVVGAISLSSHEPPWSVFKSISRDTLAPQWSMTFVGITLAVLWHFSPVLCVFIIVPAALSIRVFAAAAELRQETVEAVLKMAESIDYRDTGTSEHSQRLADLTTRLAKALDLIPEHVTEIVLASRVHDLGKIGISNDILLKQGPLTAEERRTMQAHPVIGAHILASYSAFQPSVEIVRHHHERWDGKGYPSGLKGEEIPIGSRIIAIVDAFDSVTADRPYRKGMSVEEAVVRLKGGMGSQFDPSLCVTFLRMLVEEGMYIPPEQLPDLQLIQMETVSAG